MPALSDDPDELLRKLAERGVLIKGPQLNYEYLKQRGRLGRKPCEDVRICVSCGEEKRDCRRHLISCLGQGVTEDTAELALNLIKFNSRATSCAVVDLKELSVPKCEGTLEMLYQMVDLLKTQCIPIRNEQLLANWKEKITEVCEKKRKCTGGSGRDGGEDERPENRAKQPKKNETEEDLDMEESIDGEENQSIIEQMEMVTERSIWDTMDEPPAAVFLKRGGNDCFDYSTDDDVAAGIPKDYYCDDIKNKKQWELLQHNRFRYLRKVKREYQIFNREWITQRMRSKQDSRNSQCIAMFERFMFVCMRGRDRKGEEIVPDDVIFAVEYFQEYSEKLKEGKTTRMVLVGLLDNVLKFIQRRMTITNEFRMAAINRWKAVLKEEKRVSKKEYERVNAKTVALKTANSQISDGPIICYGLLCALVRHESIDQRFEGALNSDYIDRAEYNFLLDTLITSLTVLNGTRGESAYKLRNRNVRVRNEGVKRIDPKTIIDGLMVITYETPKSTSKGRVAVSYLVLDHQIQQRLTWFMMILAKVHGQREVESEEKFLIKYNGRPLSPQNVFDSTTRFWKSWGLEKNVKIRHLITNAAINSVLNANQLDEAITREASERFPLSNHTARIERGYYADNNERLAVRAYQLNSQYAREEMESENMQNALSDLIISKTNRWIREEEVENEEEEDVNLLKMDNEEYGDYYDGDMFTEYDEHTAPHIVEREEEIETAGTIVKDEVGWDLDETFVGNTTPNSDLQELSTEENWQMASRNDTFSRDQLLDFARTVAVNFTSIPQNAKGGLWTRIDGSNLTEFVAARKNVPCQAFKGLQVRRNSLSAGVYSTERIDRGRILCDYRGYYVTTEEHDLEMLQLEEEERCFVHDYLLEVTGGYVQAHQPMKGGSVMVGRYLNHSPHPQCCNVVPKKIHIRAYGDPVIVFVSTKQIEEGEQLLWTYGTSFKCKNWFHECPKCSQPQPLTIPRDCRSDALDILQAVLNSDPEPCTQVQPIALTRILSDVYPNYYWWTLQRDGGHNTLSSALSATSQFPLDMVELEGDSAEDALRNYLREHPNDAMALIVKKTRRDIGDAKLYVGREWTEGMTVTSLAEKIGETYYAYVPNPLYATTIFTESNEEMKRAIQDGFTLDWKLDCELRRY